MGADQIAAISPLLRELLEESQSPQPELGELCATFSVPSVDIAWVQVLPGTINFGYPCAEEPEEFLRSRELPRLPGMSVNSCLPGSFVTLSHDLCPVRLLAEFIDQLLISLHNLDPGNYEIDAGFERL